MAQLPGPEGLRQAADLIQMIKSQDPGYLPVEIVSGNAFIVNPNIFNSVKNEEWAHVLPNNKAGSGAWIRFKKVRVL